MLAVQNRFFFSETQTIQIVTVPNHRFTCAFLQRQDFSSKNIVQTIKSVYWLKSSELLKVQLLSVIVTQNQNHLLNMHKIYYGYDL